MTSVPKKPLRARFTFTLALPHLLALPDGQLSAKLGRHCFAIRFEGVGLPPQSTGSASLHIGLNPISGAVGECSPGTHVPGAMLTYTLVSIGFAMPVQEWPATHQEKRQATALAHKFLNHVLDHYRLATKDASIFPLSRAQFHDVRAGRVLRYRIEPDDPEALAQASGGQPIMLAVYGVMFRDEAPAVARAGPRTVLDDALDETFRLAVASGDTPDLASLLLLNAQRYRQDGEFRLAVFDASAALDLIVEALALQCLLRQGMEPSAATARVERVTTKPAVEEIIALSVGWDILADPHWKQWDASCRSLRNRIVHDGYQPLEPEATAALETIDQLCRTFRSCDATPAL